jgi:hypothetical protein
MSVDVGMDVHRKRSQVAIIDAAGAQQRNRNVPNHPAQLVPILGALPPGTPVAFEAAYAGLAGRAARGAGAGTAPGPSQPLQGDRLGPAAGRQGGCGHPGPAAAGRLVAPGLDRAPGHPRSAGLAGPPGQPGPRGHRRQEPGACDPGRPGHPGPLQPVDRSRASLASRPGAASDPRAILQDRGGLLDALATRSPAPNARSPPWPSPIHGSRRSWPPQESASSPR